MFARHSLRLLVTSLAALLLLWQAANVLAQAIPVRSDTDLEFVGVCECGSGMCDPGHVYHARLKKSVIRPIAWADIAKMSPVLPELRPEPRVSLIHVAAPAPGRVFRGETERIPVASPFLRSPKLLL